VLAKPGTFVAALPTHGICAMGGIAGCSKKNTPPRGLSNNKRPLSSGSTETQPGGQEFPAAGGRAVRALERGIRFET